ncbi:HlyC/CorC family transporter [Roseospira marina]|uniref:HlyC/CorC family transporter n=1 Tax=Roseospira marina TaxID=140057 RepID=A0A5M6I9P6_9PROT|nr:hemolysin family protein [Roseospira marina]KAA5604960.1 HlyC/CorC family transporter [Roseospira marina]MBB4315041.1 CBS domain containing-hemolysin-like protein [Roseospira marina]MBB5088041.1 CBS domain containing-hemolysin-like protein [Roseospira marina]
MNDDPTPSRTPGASPPADPERDGPTDGDPALERTPDGLTDGSGESLGDWLRGLFRGRGNGDGSVRGTLEEIIETRDEAELPIDAHERLLIANVLHQRDMTAEDVMVPRPDIVALGDSATLPEIATLMAEKGHSRMPVYRDSLDDTAGMVHIKDLIPHLHRGEQPDVVALARPVLFVPPSIRVLDLLLEMRLKKTHMALVVDEYGGIDGLVTIEDLVEQIVGEIEDEHDGEVEPELAVQEDGSVIADARFDLEEFEERFGAILSEEEREETDTLAGLVFRLAGRVPSRGELLVHDSGLEFEVLEADPRRIKRLRLRNLPPEVSEPTRNGNGGS